MFIRYYESSYIWQMLSQATVGRLDKYEPAILQVPFVFFNALRQKQNGRYLPDDIFECIFVNENASILL